jgi:AraC-like DNA-binding protein
MAYNLRNLFVEVESRLLRKPQIRLSEIARDLRVSRRTVETAVNLARGTTFRQLQKQKVLAKAEELLDQANLSRKEIAALLGYQSPGAFSRFIKSNTGHSPTQLRKHSCLMSPQ